MIFVALQVGQRVEREFHEGRSQASRMVTAADLKAFGGRQWSTTRRSMVGVDDVGGRRSSDHGWIVEQW